MTLVIAHSRGWLDYEERVCTYWPDFAQQGKGRITVRQLLAHEAGLFAFNEPVDQSTLLKWRVGARWYAAALLIAPALMTAWLASGTLSGTLSWPAAGGSRHNLCRGQPKN